MSSRTLLVLVALALSGLAPAEAQIRPQSSGQPSFDEPQMRRHGSGFHRPNRPHHHRHHRRHHPGFR